ncbi:MAG: T9SS type A sorting domain-containing protein [Bacteroidia bacterium]|nr:T9SS type A sorting domain-containing protein [Bacteroidia bacterium]
MPILCNGGTAKYMVVATGGAGPYSGDGLYILSAGTTVITVTDANNCSEDVTIDVSEPSVLTAQAYEYMPILCNGGTAEYMVVATGGAGPYSGDGLYILSAGTTVITVTDANNCSVDVTIDVSEPSVLTAQAYVLPVLCNGGTTSVFVTTSGGTGNIYGIGNYILPNGGQIVLTLQAGDYSYTVTDSNGCITDLTFTITEPDQLGLTGIVTDVSAPGANDGSIVLNVYGGMSPYQFYWSNGAMTEDINSLIAGDYYVTVIDANGCVVTGSFNVSQPSQILISGIVVSPSCSGGNDGSISLSINGGTSPYQFYWWNSSFGATSENIYGLYAGNYSVIVTDYYGNTQYASFDVIDPLPIMISGSVVNSYCNTTPSGAINIIVTNGTAPFTYSWSNGETTENITGLGVGDYSVVVTDANGCSSSASFNVAVIGQFDAFIQTLSSYNGYSVSCNGMTNGSAIVETDGGVSPYSYSWSNGSTTDMISDVYAGTYYVTVTDSNGCSVIGQSLVSIGGNTSINWDVNNTTSTHLILIDTGVVTIDGLPVENGDLIGVFYQQGSSLACGGYITWNGNTQVLVAQGSDPGMNNGFASGEAFTWKIMRASDLAIADATPVYDLSFPNAGNYADNGISGLISLDGITNGSSSNILYGVNLTEPLSLTISLDVQNYSGYQISCPGHSDGKIVAVVNGGVSPYSYLWSTGQTNSHLSNLPAGTYYLTVTDANGCISFAYATLNEPPALELFYSTSDVTCNGGSNGAISLTVNGGATPYTYYWSNGDTTQDLSGVTAGNYVVVVVDANGCTIGSGMTINESSALMAQAYELMPVLCNGGAAEYYVLASGGTGTYTGEGMYAVYAGTTIITVTDANNCSVDVTITVSEPAPLNVYGYSGNSECNGGTGWADIYAYGGTYPYSGTGYFYQYAGTNTYTVYDYNGCQASTTITVGEPDALVVTLSATPILCNGGTSDVTVNATGGTAPYYNTGIFTEFAGSHPYTVIDSHGCQTSTSINFGEPDALVATSTATDILCNGGTSDVTVDATGGTPLYYNTGVFNETAGTYTYTVSDSNGCQAITTITVSEPSAITIYGDHGTIACNGGVTWVMVYANGGAFPNGGAVSGYYNESAGTHTYTMTDDNNCTVTYTVTLSEPDVLVATSTATDILCNGGTSDVTVDATGGTAPYYLTGVYTETAGTYTYTVYDSNGCQASTTISIGEPDILVVTTYATDILCNGGTSDKTVGAYGGTPPYFGTGTYTVYAGTYYYSVFDSNGCQANAAITISEPDALVATSSSTDILCNGGTSDVTVDATGGTAPFTGTGTFNVTAGTYTYTVIDVNGCQAITTITVGEPAMLAATSTAGTILCHGGSTGITVDATGGTAPYTGTGTFNVTAGTYTYTVIDVNGCQAITMITVGEPAALVATYSANNATCYGCANGSINVTVSGGTLPYTYIWSNGATTQNISGLIAGYYTISVYDVHNCFVSSTIQITQPSPNPPVLTYTLSDVSCYGGNNGFINVNVSGGVSPYSFAWSNSATTENINGLSSGTYSIVVTDFLGSTAGVSVVITQPAQIISTVNSANVTCYGGNDGAAYLSVTGGTTPYTYHWSNQATSQNLSNLTAGVYHVTIIDAHGCTAVNSVTVNGAADPLDAFYETTASTCLPNGSVTLYISGGVAPYSYLWSNGATTDNLMNVISDNYSVTVTDSYGCSMIVDGIFVDQDIMTEVITHTTLNCYGDATAEANIAVSGGALPYTYLWSNGGTTESITGLSAGTYSVTIIDATGCMIVDNTTIVNPVQLIVNAFETYTGGTVPLGAVVQVVQGGVAPFTYHWSNGQPFQGIRHLTFGVTYCVTVTDAHGCFAVSCVTYVSAPPPIANNNDAQNSAITDRGSVVNDITELSTTSFDAKLYPNPNIDGKFWIELSNNDYKTVQIDVVDITGRVIYNKLVPDNFNSSFYIDLSNVRTGTYFVRILTDTHGLITKPVVIAGNR